MVGADTGNPDADFGCVDIEAVVEFRAGFRKGESLIGGSTLALGCGFTLEAGAEGGICRVHKRQRSPAAIGCHSLQATMPMNTAIVTAENIYV